MEVNRNMDDAEMVANLRSGKRMDETIKFIYRNYFHSLRWYVMNNSGSYQDAEDLFQEVIVEFIYLVQKGKFGAESTVRTFLFSLNRHTWLNELKRRGRDLAGEEKYEPGKDRKTMDVSQIILGRESTTQLVQLMDQLGETCKKILLLFYYENMSIKGILENVHYDNEQMVRNKKYECLKQLEQMVNGNPALRQTLKKALHG